MLTTLYLLKKMEISYQFFISYISHLRNKKLSFHSLDLERMSKDLNFMRVKGDALNNGL